METLISIVSVVCLIVFFLVAGWVESIRQLSKLQLREQMASRLLISRIAEKSGVTKDEISNILQSVTNSVK